MTQVQLPAMSYDRECVYDVFWQKLRVRLLGSWDTPSNVQECITTLTNYAQDNSAFDKYERYVRVKNLCAAVLLGYGSKADFVECAKIVRRAHHGFSLKSVHLSPSRPWWDWKKVEDDLNNWTTLEELRAIEQNLQGRIRTSMRRRGTTKFRPELMTFFGMLQKAIHVRT